MQIASASAREGERDKSGGIDWEKYRYELCGTDGAIFCAIRGSRRYSSQWKRLGAEKAEDEDQVCGRQC